MAKTKNPVAPIEPTAAAAAEPGPSATRVSSQGSGAPDLQKELAALRAENARLRAGAVEEREVLRYPCVMYRKHRVDDRHPNGYERRRVQEEDAKGNLDADKCAALVERLEKEGWVHSPADIAA